VSDRKAPRLETVSALGRAPARVAPRMPSLPSMPPPPEEPRSLWQRTRVWLHGALFDNLVLKFVSMVLALTVFILVNTDREREIVARVGISYTLPEDKVLVSERIEEVQVTLKGPWRRIKRFDERELDRVHIDLTRVSGGEVAITPDQINLPAGLRLESITPRVVRVAFERREVKEVDVTPTLAGRAMHGFTVTETRIDPPRVVVRGPEGLIHALTAVRTQEVRIDGRNETFEATPLLVPPEGVEIEWEGAVAVTVQVDEQLVTRRVGPLAVTLTGVDATRFRTEPAEVKAVLTGGLRAVEKATEQGVLAVARALPGGPRTVPVAIENVPPGVGVQVVPAQVTIVPRRPAPPP
jgi:YbbR domain-containing protein